MSETLPGKYPMRFIKVKGGPSNFVIGSKVYIPNDIVPDLPSRYANFRWFEIVKELEGIKLPDEGQVFEHEEGFDIGLSEDLEFKKDTGAFYNPDVDKAKSEAEQKLDTFNRMTKDQLKQYIVGKGGEVKTTWNKDKLIEEAVNVSSPTLS